MKQFDLLVQSLLEAAGKDSPVGGMKDDNYELPTARKHWSYKTPGKKARGFTAKPEGVRSTLKAISDALEKVDLTAGEGQQLENVIKEYMSMYVDLTARFAQFKRTEEALGNMYKTMEKASARNDFDTYDKLAEKYAMLKAQARAEEVNIKKLQDKMALAQEESYSQIKELIYKQDPQAANALERYYAAVEGRKREAAGIGYAHMFHDIVKSVAEFLKNTRDAREKKVHRTLSKYNIPQDYQALIKMVKRADVNDKDTALEFVKNLPGDTNPFKRALLNVELKKYYNALEQGDIPQQAALVKSIYSLAGQTA